LYLKLWLCSTGQYLWWVISLRKIAVLTTLILFFNCDFSKWVNQKKTLPDKGFPLQIQIISFTFAHNLSAVRQVKSDINTWDFLTGLHKK